MCNQHEAANKARIDRERKGNDGRKWQKSKRWQKARQTYLANNPLCVRCLHNGKTKASSVVDHIIPHKGDYELFWSRYNWQALCKRCHDIKTVTEDGGYGHKRKAS